jgi:ribose 5-phosphate isomerase B
MRVHLGSDHAGFELKASLVTWLRGRGHEPVDHGPAECVADDDYPPYVLAAATSVAAEPGSFGIVIGGSGNGEAIAANKVRRVRAALAWNAETAQLARRHNDANMISIGARMHTTEEAIELVDLFLGTEFSEEPRHARRIAMIADYEETGALPSSSPSSG